VTAAGQSSVTQARQRNDMTGWIPPPLRPLTLQKSDFQGLFHAPGTNLQNLRIYAGAASERKAGWLTSGAPSPMTGCSQSTHKPFAHRRRRNKGRFCRGVGGATAGTAHPRDCAHRARFPRVFSRNQSGTTRALALTCPPALTVLGGLRVYLHRRAGDQNLSRYEYRATDRRTESDAWHTCLAHHGQLFYELCS
jgi:hypothetical protein